MQPLIAFSILAMVLYQGESELESARKVEARHPIIMASGTDPDPPLYTYLTSERWAASRLTTLKSGYLGTPLARIRVLMYGRETLHSSSASHEQHAKRYLSFGWYSLGTLELSSTYVMTLRIRTSLIRKTYYGVQRLADAVDNDSLFPSKGGNVRLREETFDLGVRICRMAFPQPGASAADPFLPSKSLLLPIESDRIISPTFVTAYAMRKDTLRVSVKFQGYRHDTVVLESPIHVSQCFTTRPLERTDLEPSSFQRCGGHPSSEVEVISMNIVSGEWRLANHISSHFHRILNDCFPLPQMVRFMAT